MKSITYQVIQRVLIGAVFTALFACSSENVNEPEELKPFVQTVFADRNWSRSAGDGDEELMLELRPVLDRGQLYIIDRFGELNAFAARDGQRLWERELEEQVSAGLGVDRSHLYYATFQGDLVCLDRTNGNEIWRRPLSSEAAVAPVSNGSSVAVQTIDGQLFVFETTEGLKRWQYDSANPILTLRGSAQPVFHDGMLVAGFANGELRAFDARTGRQKWRAVAGVAQGRTELERLIDVDGDPVILDDVLYALAYQGNLLALDVRTGQELWKKSLSSFNTLAVANGRIIASLDDGVVMAMDASGANELWRNESFKYRRLSKPTIVGDSVLLGDFEGYVHVLALEDGTIQGRFRPDSDGIMEHVIPAGNRFFMATRSGDLMAYTLEATSPVVKRKHPLPLGQRREEF